MKCLSLSLIIFFLLNSTLSYANITAIFCIELQQVLLTIQKITSPKAISLMYFSYKKIPHQYYATCITVLFTVILCLDTGTRFLNKVFWCIY